MTIYADEIFAVNAFSNEMLMYSYCMIRGIKPRHGRIALSSAICGVYAAVETVFTLPHILRAGVLAALAYTIFGKEAILKHIAELMFICFAVEGITITAISAAGGYAELAKGGITLFASEPVTAGIYVLSYPAFVIIQTIRGRKKKYQRLAIEHRNRKIELNVLHDSGNLLRYHNKPVVMIAWEAAAPLFDFKSFAELKEGAEAFVIYETISGAGVVPVIEPERCRLDGAEVSAAAAVVERKFKGKYCGIAGDI